MTLTFELDVDSVNLTSVLNIYVKGHIV